MEDRQDHYHSCQGQSHRGLPLSRLTGHPHGKVENAGLFSGGFCFSHSPHTWGQVHQCSARSASNNDAIQLFAIPGVFTSFSFNAGVCDGSLATTHRRPLHTTHPELYYTSTTSWIVATNVTVVVSCSTWRRKRNMTSFSARDWHQLYEATKRQIVNKRQNGSRMTEKESSTLTGNVQTLDAQLNIMSNNVMEYEIATSEIARRQTLLENLKKQMLFVLAPNSRISGFGQSDGPPAGGVALNPLHTSDKGITIEFR
jgi:small nuclear ribonucleoprotein (snRNP)-like protein